MTEHIRKGQLMWVDLRPVVFPDNQRHTCEATFVRYGVKNREWLITPSRYAWLIRSAAGIEPIDRHDDFGMRLLCSSYIKLFEQQRDEEWASLADAVSY